MTDPAVPQAFSPSYHPRLPAPRRPELIRYDDAPDPIEARPIDRPPSGALAAVPDQSGVWSVDSGSYALPTGRARVWSSDGSGWTGSQPVVRQEQLDAWDEDEAWDEEWPEEWPEPRGAVPAVREVHEVRRAGEAPVPVAPEQPAAWTVDDRWPNSSGVPALREEYQEVERAPQPTASQPHAWPIDRPLTGAFPTVPAWGTPLRVAGPGVYNPHLSRRSLSGRAGRDARTRALLTAGCWLLTALVLWTWGAGGAFGQIASGDTVSLLRAGGHLAALVASSLLLVQLVLMARLPALENTIGRDRLVRVHAFTGFTSFTAMLAHIALATFAYSAARIDRVLPTFWGLTWEYPGMLLAVVGTLLIVAVVMSSTKRVRKRLSYEGWHLLHLYAYLGAGLALPHQLWTGKDFLRSPLITASWWAVWGLTAALMIVWRIVIPLQRSIRHDIRVAAVVREGSRMVSVYLTGRRLDDLAEAGQFLVWRFVDRPGWIRANPFSISAAPQPDRLRITVREAGDGSRSLADLEPGTRVLVEGAYGRLTARSRTHRKVAFIGAGSGMAPLRSLAEGLSYAPGEAIMIERFTDEPFLPEELDWLARERGLRVARLGGRRRGPDSWVGEGYDGDSDADVVRGWIPDLEEYDVFLCGAAPWAESVRRALSEAGLPAEQLHSEAFGW